MSYQIQEKKINFLATSSADYLLTTNSLLERGEKKTTDNDLSFFLSTRKHPKTCGGRGKVRWAGEWGGKEMRSTVLNVLSSFREKIYTKQSLRWKSRLLIKINYVQSKKQLYSIIRDHFHLFLDYKKQNAKSTPSAGILHYLNICRENRGSILVRLLAQQKGRAKCNPVFLSHVQNQKL